MCNFDKDSQIFFLDFSFYGNILISLRYSEQYLISCRLPAINVQPDPLRFVQLTTEYWEEFGPARPGWMNLPYAVPPGCLVSNLTSVCPPGSLDPAAGVTYCQVCPKGEPWSYYDWIMTARPNVFGLIDGWANPTGVVLMAIIVVMVICSMPFVRRGGYFEVRRHCMTRDLPQITECKMCADY